DDLDGDGWLDILTAGGCRCSDPPGCTVLHPLLRVAPRLFQDREDLVGENHGEGAWTVFSTNIGPGEKVIAWLGNACQNDDPIFQHEVSRDADGYPRFKPVGVPPQSFYNVQGTGSPMGASVGDIDGDGQLDLAVSLQTIVELLAGGPDFPL